MKIKLFTTLITLFLFISTCWSAQLSLELKDLEQLSSDQVEEIITISYGITDPEQLESVLTVLHSYVKTHPEFEPLYRQRVQHSLVSEQLGDCVDENARQFSDRILDDAITVKPCHDITGAVPLDSDFKEFAEEMVEHLSYVENDAVNSIQDAFLQTSIISAAENLTEFEYLTNPDASVDSIFQQICGEGNRNPVTNFFTGKKKYTECEDDLAPEKIKNAIRKRFNSLEGQPRYQLPQDQQAILSELNAIVTELNSALGPISATVRPVRDMSGRVVESPLKTFGPQVGLQLSSGSQESYQNFLRLFYEKTSSGVGALLLSSKIVSSLPSIEINDFGMGATSQFRKTGEVNAWGEEIYKLPPLPMPKDVGDLKDDISESIRNSAQELKDLGSKDELLSAETIGKYVAVNPLNLAKVLTLHPELTDQVCKYINWAQAYTDRREEIDSKIQTASRWIGAGGAALSLIAGPLGAVPACIIGAGAGTLATATSGLVLLRKMDHLQDVTDAMVAGGADSYSVQEIIDSYKQLQSQTLETLVELGFTVFDFVQLGKALKLSKSTRIPEVVDELVASAQKANVNSQEDLIEFANYIKHVKGDDFHHYLDLEAEVTDAFVDIHKTSPNVIMRSHERADRFRSFWRHEDLDAAIKKFAGDHPLITTTDTGKIIYTHPDTGVHIVHDYYGDYFRIEDVRIPGKRRYLNMEGEVPNNKILPNGKSTGNSNNEYNAITHFSL